MTETCYALLIGNSEYPEDPDNLPSLRCPERDVDDLRQLLISPTHGLFQEDHIKVLKNKSHSDVQHELNNLIKSAGKDDLILIYYSGHGQPDLHGHLYLTTYDTHTADLEITSVSANTISTLLRNNPRNRVVLILDCCFAGNISKDFVTKGNENNLIIENLGGYGTYILAAASADQTAKEKKGDDHSLFSACPKTAV